jgi:hypothetical protein
MARTAALEGFVVAALSAYICNGDSSVSLEQKAGIAAGFRHSPLFY